jgi:hypothetical protein
MLRILITAAAWTCLALIAYAPLSLIDARIELLTGEFLGGFFAVLERFGA